MHTLAVPHRTIWSARLLAALLLAVMAPKLAAQTPVVSPDTLFFSWHPGAPAPTPRTFSITSSTGQSFAFTAMTSGGAGWLSLGDTTGFTPAQLSVHVDPAGLVPGAYNGAVSIQANGQLRVVSVVLLVSGSTSGLYVTPSIATFQMREGGLPPPAKILLVDNPSSARIPFTVSVHGGGSWLSVLPRAGQTTTTIELEVQNTLLLKGTYTAAVSIVDVTGVIAQTAHVTLLIGEDPLVSITPPSLSFSAQVGSTLPLSQNLTVASLTGETLDTLASAASFSGGDWLDVIPASGPTNLILVVTADASNLPVGSYGGIVRVVASGRVTTVSVNLTVSNSSPLTISPRDLSFTAGGGVVPSPRNIFVESSLGGPVQFAAAKEVSWINLTPALGTTPSFLTVGADARGLDVGTYRALIEISAVGSVIPQTVLVTLRVTGVTELLADPVQVNLTAEVGSSELATQTISVSSTSGVLSWNAGLTPNPWLNVGAASNITPGSVEVSANPDGLAVGTYFGAVSITAPGAANSPLAILVTFTITPPGPVISSVRHGAAWTPGVLSPGTAVSIVGAGLGPVEGVGLEIGPDQRVTNNLSGVRVYFDEFPSVLTYVRSDQVNCMTPFGIAGRTRVNVVVEYEGLQSQPFQIQVVEAAPGIFTISEAGGGPGAILNHQDWTLNSTVNPVARGAYASVYATGAGLMDPPGLDGDIVGEDLPRPLLPVRAWIGDMEAEVSYAGGSPGLLLGVLQVDIRIPLDIPPGTHSLVIRSGDLRSQTGVTITTF